MSRSAEFLLPAPLYQMMIQQAQSELPNECCGLLGGTRDGDVLRAETCYPLINEAASPVEYLSEPRSMFQAMKAMRARGEEVVAVYHSHPTSAPVPSRTDLERAYSPDVVHFIIGLSSEEPTLRGWWLADSTYEEATWRLTPSPTE